MLKCSAANAMKCCVVRCVLKCDAVSEHGKIQYGKRGQVQVFDLVQAECGEIDRAESGEHDGHVQHERCQRFQTRCDYP